MKIDSFKDFVIFCISFIEIVHIGYFDMHIAYRTGGTDGGEDQNFADMSPTNRVFVRHSVTKHQVEVVNYVLNTIRKDVFHICLFVSYSFKNYTFG